MAHSSFLDRLECLSEKNKNFFLRHNDGFNTILYFDDSEFDCNNNFLEHHHDNCHENEMIDMMSITNVTNFSKYIQVHIPEILNLKKSNKYDSIIKIILTLIPIYKTSDLHKIFLKKNMITQLFQEYKYGEKGMNLNDLKEIINNQSFDNDLFIQLISDYFKINLVIFTDNEIKVFSKESQYKTFIPTILIYQTTNEYFYMFSEHNCAFFTNNEKINGTILKYCVQKQLIDHKMYNKECRINQITEKRRTIKKTIKKLNRTIKKLNKETIDSNTLTQNSKKVTKTSLLKIKVKKLRSICVTNSINIRDKKGKFIKKNDLVLLLLKMKTNLNLNN